MPKILLEYPNPPSPPCQGGTRAGDCQGGTGTGNALIEHIARPIDASECFDRIVFVLSPKHGKQVIDYLRRNPLETPVRFVWQNEPLGFGHAVLQAREEVFGFRKWNPPVLVATDDGVRNPADPDKPSFDLIREMVGSPTSTLGVKWVGNVRQHGMVIVKENGEARRRGGEGASKTLRPGHLPRPNSPSEEAGPGNAEDPENRERRGGEGTRKNSLPHRLAPTQTQPLVERLIEKPYWDEGGFALTGLYYVRESRRLFRCLNKLVKSGRCLGGEYQLTHALQMMIDAGTPFETHYHEWVDCGKTGRPENEKTRKRELE